MARKTKPASSISDFYQNTLHDVAKSQGFESSSLEVTPPVSTGLLCVDLMLGGGLRPGMLTAAGNEQSAKTTLALVAMAGAVNSGVPINAFVDYEGSTKSSKTYVHSVMKTAGVKLSMADLFGTPAKGKEAAIPGRVHYRAEVILERFYEYVGEVLRRLPDKRFVENQWWLVFDENNKKHKAMIGDEAVSEMSRKYGSGLWVPAPDGAIQGFIVVDSYTAMNPEVKDKADISNQLSVKASAFSKQLERVKGRLVQKMVLIYGLNHLRANPMAMYGPKEDEKGGNALKQFCFGVNTLLATSQGMLRANEINELV